MKNSVLFLIVSFAAWSMPTICQCQPRQEASGAHINKDKRQVALSGYDPVSYFTDGQPLKGKSNLSHTYRTTQYLFANPANLAAFKSNPEAYLPQYGGWCAYAMGRNGDKVKIDPMTYKLVDGKLYLFYNFRSTNTLDDWNKDEGNLKNKADRHWKKLVGSH